MAAVLPVPTQAQRGFPSCPMITSLLTRPSFNAGVRDGSVSTVGRGIHATGVAALVEAAHVSTRTFYQQFGSKRVGHGSAESLSCHLSPTRLQSWSWRSRWSRSASVQRGGSDLRASCTALHCLQRGGGRRNGLDWRAAKGPKRPPGPGPPRTLPARSSSWLSSAPAQDDVEGPATDSTPRLDPRARPRGDLDNLGRCGHLDHLSDHRDASL